MAAAAQPDPNGGADPSQGGGAPPSQSPANPKQQMLAQMYQLCTKLAQSDPVLSSGMQKAAQGIQEAQSAMLTNSPTQQPASSSPSY